MARGDRRTGGWYLLTVAVTLAAALGAAWWSGGGIFDPGPLREADADPVRRGGVASHVELARDCGACHPAPWSGETASDRCLGCHEEVRAELGDTTRLHGFLQEARACLGCHTEHEGPRANLTRFEGDGFDHARLGYDLAGHATTAGGRPFRCGDCHGGEGYAFPRDRCVGCHRDHEPEFVERHASRWGEDCLACHDGHRFGEGGFDHDTTAFALTGAHVDVACVDCHPDVRSREAYAEAATGCAGCHAGDDPHEGRFGPACGACHGTADWEDVDFEHRFPLEHGRREASECAVCHADAPESYESYTCYGCHEHSEAGVRGEHREEGIRAFADCMECHPTGREEEGEEEHEEGEEGD